MKLFLDTNVIIIGAADANTPHGAILDWIGFNGANQDNDVQLILSNVLQNEIRRVARRVRNKDWAGEIIHRLWQNCDLIIVTYEPNEDEILKWASKIPREDVGVYLTAIAGDVQHFVSANHLLLKSIAAETGAFECHTPQEFFDQFVA